MSALFEIVPNVSEGRDTALVAAMAGAMEAAGARVIHRTSDAVHHRSVITAVGTRSQVVAAAVALARVAAERIDLRAHRGVHPRIGALDVLPFVPLRGATLADAVDVAHDAAVRIWHEAGIPSFFYCAAASAPHRVDLAALRRGEFEELAVRCRDPRWAFDVGTAPHPTAGAVAIGARPFLVAFNVDLASGDVALARGIARRLRARDGGLGTLKAIGIRLGPGVVQVSCNITDVDAVPLYRVTELVRLAAARAGATILRSEVIGLVPREAVVRTARAYAGKARHEDGTPS